MSAHSFQTDDRRLDSIHEKVVARERLDFDDGVALYRTGDILAVGWLANRVREQMHGDSLFQCESPHQPHQCLRRRLPSVRVRAQEGCPGAYTMALEEALETAASGYTEAVTEFHMVGGLHPDLPFQYFLDLDQG